MKHSQHFLFAACIGLSIAVAAPAAIAALGYATPLAWAGNGARINSYDSNYSFVENVASDVSTNAGGTTAVSYDNFYDSYHYGWAESSAYVLKGSVRASSPATDIWQAGGYFRDQLYFATANGQPAELAFTFSVSASGGISSSDGFANLNLAMNVPIAPLSDPVTWNYLSNKSLIDATGDGPLSPPAGMTVTIKSTDWNPGNPDYLVQSGSYLPITFSLWGSVKDAYLDWGYTVELVSVDAFQGAQKLPTAEFTILSSNNEPGFQSFAHTAAVPEPQSYAMLLAGLGLLGFFARRAKLQAA